MWFSQMPCMSLTNLQQEILTSHQKHMFLTVLIGLLYMYPSIHSLLGYAWRSCISQTSNFFYQDTLFLKSLHHLCYFEMCHKDQRHLFQLNFLIFHRYPSWYFSNWPLSFEMLPILPYVNSIFQIRRLWRLSWAAQSQIPHLTT